MWTHQSTSTHKGPRGHVFSPCLKWKEPINHWLFVTETETTVTIVFVCVFECASLDVSIHALITDVNILCLSVCMCVWFLHVRCTGKIRQNSAFSASKYQDCSIYCLHSFDKSCSSTLHCPEKSSQMVKQIFSFSMCMWWMSSTDFVHEAKTIETKTNVCSV